MADKKVKVRIKPLHGIGGVGDAGDVVWMTKEDAEQYFFEGYVEYVEDDAAPASTTADASAQREESEAEDHQIMKPQVKRSRKK